MLDAKRSTKKFNTLTNHRLYECSVDLKEGPYIINLNN